jgi:hypothetical protein
MTEPEAQPLEGNVTMPLDELLERHPLPWTHHCLLIKDANGRQVIHTGGSYNDRGRVYEGRYLSGLNALLVELVNTRSDLPRATADTFQSRVDPWLQHCFGPQIAADVVERNHRFLEEALELVQSLGCTQSEAHQLVEYVFNRDSGNAAQEVGGVMVTLAALCLANSLDMHISAESELERIWTKTEVIRAKQAAKPQHSPLPATPRATGETTVEAIGRQALAAELLGHLDRIASPTAAFHLVKNLCKIELGQEPDSLGLKVDL